MCTIRVQSYGICTQFCVISLCDFAVVSYVHHSMWYVCVTCVKTHGLFLLLKCWVHWWFVWQVCVMCASDSTPKLLFCFSCEHHAHLHIYVTQVKAMVYEAVDRTLMYELGTTFVRLPHCDFCPVVWVYWTICKHKVLSCNVPNVCFTILLCFKLFLRDPKQTLTFHLIKKIVSFNCFIFDFSWY